MKDLLLEIRKCTTCIKDLPFGCRPVLEASTSSKILIIGQAPGRVVHNTGIPWDDASGKNLRAWMNIDSDTFYDASKIAIVPMGFCYPGTGKTGDFAPRKECAPQWHEALIEQMPEIKLILLIGTYAQKYYLKKSIKKNLTETVNNFHEYLPLYFPLPHPSPRNNIWQKKNPWFKKDVLPNLQDEIKKILS